MYFNLGHMDNAYVWRFFSRPSVFETWAEWERYMSALIGAEELPRMRILRLDLALDYSCDIARMIAALDVPGKQIKVAYRDKAGAKTGILLGSGAEKIQIYDKAREQRIPGPLTRIEFQLLGKKLPGRTIETLCDSFRNGWNPFEKLQLAEHLVEPQLTEGRQKRAARLQSLMEQEGFFSARQTLNGDGNFGRDFGPLLKRTPWQEQPAEAFRRTLRGFLDGIEHGSAPYNREED